MELLCKKTKAEDRGLIKASDLLANVYDALDYLKNLYIKLEGDLGRIEKAVISMPDDIVNRETIEESMKLDGVFSFVSPICITGHPSLENNISIQGVIYFDEVNNRYRVKTKKGWKTLTLSDE